MMPRESITIPISTSLPHEAAATLFGIIAYPDAADWKRRALFETAMYYKAVAGMVEESQHWARTHQPIRPGLLVQDPKRMQVEFQRGVRIIANERLIAAKMAGPTINRFNRDRGQSISNNLDSHSAPTSEAAWTAASLDLDERRGKNSRGNKGNMVDRHWKPSHPVLHLSLALHEVIALESPQPGAAGLNVGDFMRSPELLLAVIVRAQAVWPAVAGAEYLAIPEDQLIWVQAS